MIKRHVQEHFNEIDPMFLGHLPYGFVCMPMMLHLQDNRCIIRELEKRISALETRESERDEMVWHKFLGQIFFVYFLF